MQEVDVKTLCGEIYEFVQFAADPDRRKCYSHEELFDLGGGMHSVE